jgi:hypothetical protein
MNIRTSISVLAVLAAFFIGGVMTLINDHVGWSYVLWGLACFLLLFFLIYYLIVRNNTKRNTQNWIISYESRNKKLPAIPEYLLSVVQKYEIGSPLTKEIEIINMSGQFWNNLLPSQREELKQLVEWLDMNWDDYLEQMKRMLPKNLNLGKTNKPFQQE